MAQVVIVGGRPVGLLLATELALGGSRTDVAGACRRGSTSAHARHARYVRRVHAAPYAAQRLAQPLDSACPNSEPTQAPKYDEYDTSAVSPPAS